MILQNQRGVTLVSALVSTAVLVILSLFLFRGVSEQYRFSYESFERVQAMNFAREILEYYIGRGYVGLCDSDQNDEYALTSVPPDGTWVKLVDSNQGAVDENNYNALIGQLPVQYALISGPVDLPYSGVRMQAASVSTDLSVPKWRRVVWGRQVEYINLEDRLNDTNPMDLVNAPSPDNSVPHWRRAIVLVATVVYPAVKNSGSANPVFREVSLPGVVPLTRNANMLKAFASDTFAGDATSGLNDRCRL